MKNKKENNALEFVLKMKNNINNYQKKYNAYCVELGIQFTGKKKNLTIWKGVVITTSIEKARDKAFNKMTKFFDHQGVGANITVLKLSEVSFDFFICKESLLKEYDSN